MEKIRYLAHYPNKLVFVEGKDVAEILVILEKKGFGKPIKLALESCVHSRGDYPKNNIFGTYNKYDDSSQFGPRYHYVCNVKNKEKAIDSLQDILEVELSDKDVGFFGEYHDLVFPNLASTTLYRKDRKPILPNKKRLVCVANNYLNSCKANEIMNTPKLSCFDFPTCHEGSDILSLLKIGSTEPTGAIAILGRCRKNYVEPENDGTVNCVNLKDWLFSSHPCGICNSKALLGVWLSLSIEEQKEVLNNLTVAAHIPATILNGENYKPTQKKLLFGDIKTYEVGIDGDKFPNPITTALYRQQCTELKSTGYNRPLNEETIAQFITEHKVVEVGTDCQVRQSKRFDSEDLG